MTHILTVVLFVCSVWYVCNRAKHAISVNVEYGVNEESSNLLSKRRSVHQEANERAFTFFLKKTQIEKLRIVVSRKSFRIN